MKITRALPLAALALCLALPALAQAVVNLPAFPPNPTVEAVQPWAVFLQPYVTMLLQTVAGGAILLAAGLIQKWFGIKIDDAKLARVKACAETQVNNMVAGAEDNLKNKTIDVHNSAVKSAADTVIAVLPGLVKDLGLTPESIQRIVVGEIGKVQKEMSASASPAIVQTGDKPTAVNVEAQPGAVK